MGADAKLSQRGSVKLTQGRSITRSNRNINARNSGRSLNTFRSRREALANQGSRAGRRFRRL